jgi:ceramide glucosyltransferase
MLTILLNALACLCALLALGGAFYLGLTLVALRDYTRSRRAAAPDAGLPLPVSILKPLRGVDRGLYEALRSHCLQQYSAGFELICGVADPADPAVALVEKLQAEFPALRIETVICPRQLGLNRKVSSLVQMLPHARYEHLIVSDGDIRVSPLYLQKTMRHFADPQVGLVTALYRARHGATLASRLEALGIGTDFAGGVLCSRYLAGGLRIGMGSTLAMPRQVLAAIGGFEPLLNWLADDNALGARAAAAGYRVVLSGEAVETTLPDYGFSAMFAHQMRWARTVRDLEKLGYLGSIVTFALPWAILATLFARGAAAAWGLLLAVILLRGWTAVRLCRLLDDRSSLRELWLLPLRDSVALGIWLASWCGNSVEWRGERFRVKNGSLQKL